MITIFKSPGVYTIETDYWLPPEVMKSMSRRMKIAKIFKDESLFPVMKDGSIDHTGISRNPY